MSVKGIRVYEWTIENFSCWNAEIHGDVIKCRSASLYPRGKGECLEVRIIPLMCEVDRLEVIASDGSVICALSKDSDEYWIFRRGPRFSEVVSRIKDKEDRLTLRWKEAGDENFDYCYCRSLICVFDAFVELDSSFFFRDLQIEGWQHVTVLRNHIDVECAFSACRNETKNEEVQIKLKSRSSEKKILVRASLLIQKADVITKTFEKDISLEGEHQFSFLQPEKDEKIFWRFKFITGRSERFVHLTDVPRTNYEPDAPDHRAMRALSRDLKCLYQDQDDFSDFELRSGNEFFPTHRVILSARSPVFKAMLSGETTAGHVDVEDLDPDTIGRFLAFLYSGTTGDEVLGWKEAIKLYHAAAKYQVPSLKEECAAVLCTSVWIENVCDILSLADRHKDEELTSVARDFISENFNEVLGSKNWEKFMLSDPLLAVKTVTYFVQNKYALKKN